MKMVSVCSVILFIASTALAQGGTPALPQQPAGIGERGSGQTQSTMERTTGQQRRMSEREASTSSDILGASSEQRANEAGNTQVPKGIIGVSLRILANRIGDRSSLYIAQ